MLLTLRIWCGADSRPGWRLSRQAPGIGLIAAALVARVSVSMLPGLSALDAATYVTVALLMIGCAAVSGLSAAWRLRRLSPAEALRAD